MFDYSLWGVRLFPSLAGLAILILCCLMVRELKGNFKAVFFAGITVLAFTPFYRNHTLFQPVAFDQLFWALGFYFILRFINSGKNKALVWLGIALGLGLMTKYTILVWAFGAVIGLIFLNGGKTYKNKWLYAGAGLALLIFLPNLVWQIKHDFPLIQHLGALQENQLSAGSRWDFLLEQLEITPTFAVVVLGFVGLFMSQKLRPYRSLGITALVIFGVMWLADAKTYYIFALYPLLFAAGSVYVESLLVKRSWLMYPLAAIVLLPMIFYIPMATPILPIDKFIAYADVEESNDGRYELTGDYADMFGWNEQVRLIDSIYKSIEPRRREKTVLWAENYGEAGALKILGKKYDLPNPISRHGSFWSWGYGDPNAELWLSLGNEEGAVNYIFEEVILVKTITHPYAIEEENGIPIYLCGKPKQNIADWWAAYEDYIFD